MLHKSRLENILLLSRMHQKNKTQKGHFRAFFSPTHLQELRSPVLPQEQAGNKAGTAAYNQGGYCFQLGTVALWDPPGCGDRDGDGDKNGDRDGDSDRNGDRGGDGHTASALHPPDPIPKPAILTPNTFFSGQALSAPMSPPALVALISIINLISLRQLVLWWCRNFAWGTQVLL